MEKITDEIPRNLLWPTGRKDSDRTVGLNRSARASADVTTVTTIPNLSPTACQFGPDQTVATVRQQDVVVAGKERRSAQTFQSYRKCNCPKKTGVGLGLSGLSARAICTHQYDATGKGRVRRQGERRLRLESS